MKDVDYVKNIQKDANTFLDHALALNCIAGSDNDMEKIMVLDSNLKLWVEIETTLKDSRNALPKNLKDNLAKLSVFVKQTILSKGLNMDKTTIECLVNINMQISEGLYEAAKSVSAKEEAYSLLKCASDIAKAKEDNDNKALVGALDNNLRLWTYIKTLAERKQSALPSDLKNNLVKLSDYVSSQTFRIGQNLENENIVAIESLITTNVHISEGLSSEKVS